MKTGRSGWLLTWAALAVSAFAAGAVHAQSCSGTITQQEASQAEDARYAAQTSNDFDAMRRMFADDLVYIHSGAVVDDKDRYIESMRSGSVKYRVMRRSDARVRTFGCLAIITGDADFDVTVKGQEMSVPLRFHSIWARRDGRPQFVSWQATRVPPSQ
ncbi:MAG: nuclear transport factor 2 family protein [Burkholderiales bacterium]|nr:nuclear transport factor 2 family protein [Burkholderiales bacterium]